MVDLSSFACALPVNWFQKVLIWCLVLLGVLVAVALAFMVALRQARDRDETASDYSFSDTEEPQLPRRNSRADYDSRLSENTEEPQLPRRNSRADYDSRLSEISDKIFGRQRPPELEARFGGYGYIVMLVVYPFLSPAAVSVFNCHSVNGVAYLEADYSLHCYDTAWKLYALLSGFVIVIYVFGLPCLTLYAVIQGWPSVAFISAGYRTDGGSITAGWEVGFVSPSASRCFLD